jgi:GNAT superfamily N-acetyltransferase
MLNRALGVGLLRPATERQLDEIVTVFAERGCVCSLAVAPEAEPSELPSWLEARGFAPGYAWMKFSRPVGPAPRVETDLQVAEIGPEQAEAFGRVVAAAYGLPEELVGLSSVVVGRPGWHCFMAFADDAPAGAAALHAQDGVGWLGFAGTVPELRGRGAQNALLAARLARAAELGLALLVTETGERLPDRPSNSYRNIQRNGFEEAYLRPNWIRAADRAS